MQPLEPAHRRALRAKAHHLDPVVTIGHHGLTPAVRREIDVALAAHELIKVRLLGDDRRARETVLARLCSDLDCAPVQQIGKLLVLFRPRPAQAVASAPAGRKGPAKASSESAGKRRPGVATRRVARPPGGAGAMPGVRAGTRPAVAAGVPGKPPGASAATRAPRGVPRATLPRRRRGV